MAASEFPPLIISRKKPKRVHVDPGATQAWSDLANGGNVIRDTEHDPELTLEFQKMQQEIAQRPLTRKDGLVLSKKLDQLHERYHEERTKVTTITDLPVNRAIKVDGELYHVDPLVHRREEEEDYDDEEVFYSDDEEESGTYMMAWKLRRPDVRKCVADDHFHMVPPLPHKELMLDWIRQPGYPDEDMTTYLSNITLRMATGVTELNKFNLLRNFFWERSNQQRISFRSLVEQTVKHTQRRISLCMVRIAPPPHNLISIVYRLDPQHIYYAVSHWETDRHANIPDSSGGMMNSTMESEQKQLAKHVVVWRDASGGIYFRDNRLDDFGLSKELTDAQRIAMQTEMLSSKRWRQIIRSEGRLVNADDGEDDNDELIEDEHDKHERQLVQEETNKEWRARHWWAHNSDLSSLKHLRTAYVTCACPVRDGKLSLNTQNLNRQVLQL